MEMRLIANLPKAIIRKLIASQALPHAILLQCALKKTGARHAKVRDKAVPN